jgi:uncharacterized repeat protein (TIGR03803 family)
MKTQETQQHAQILDGHGVTETGDGSRRDATSNHHVEVDVKSRNNLAKTIRRRHFSMTLPRVLAITVLLGISLVAIPAMQAQFSVIHNFTAGGDGATPYGGLTLDAGGNLFGTTSNGGSGGYGTVYKMSFKGSGWVLGTL